MVFDASQVGPLKREDRQRFQGLFVDQATGAFLKLSFGMGIAAFLLPIAVVLASGYHGNYSISWFYHAGETSRNLLVGGLWATGMFLFLFRGLSKLENRLLNAAGVFGISVAMNPMAASQCQAQRTAFSMHAVSAILFFLSLSIVAVGLSKERVRYIADLQVRRRFKISYNAAGVAMLAMPAAVAAIHFLGRSGCDSHWIFWVETFGIWAFAFYWFVKTIEYRLLLGVRMEPRPATAANVTIANTRHQ